MQRRPPSIGRAAVVSPWRGLLRVQKWPKPRGIPTDPKAKARLDLFRLIQRGTKLLQEKETRAMREGIKAHNDAHRGQRGSAAIRQRDWHHQRLAGRGFIFETEDGITIYPKGVSRTASHLFDHIADQPPAIPTRVAEQWVGTETPTGPAVLAINPAGDGLTWVPIETTEGT